MKTQTLTYLLCLFFFKVCAGAILLVTGWDSLGISGNGLINITIIMALSFFPAAFARPLFQKLGTISIPKLLTFCLCISGILTITEHFLMSLNLVAMFATHFILWVFIFVIEVGTEKWYVELSQGYDLNKIRKLSGISTSVGQLGIILGPITVMIAKKYNQSLPYWIILFCFIIAATFAFLTIFNSRIQKIISNNCIVEAKTGSNNRRFWYVLGFALIWPTLTIFNLSVPVLAKTQYNSINVAGIFEITIAFATVIAGFTHSYVTSSMDFRKRTFFIFVTLFFSAITSYLYNNRIIIVSLAIFLLGLSFGYLRVELRSQLSRLFEPKIAGEIVATANSWSGFLVIIYASFFYLCTQIQGQTGLTISFPLSFVFCAALFIYILNHESKHEERLSAS